MINPMDVPMVFGRRDMGGVTTVYDSRTSMVATPTSPVMRTDETKAINMWGKFFKSMSRVPVLNETFETKSGLLKYPPAVYQSSNFNYPLELKTVDLCLAENCASHHTSQFHITTVERDAKLVLRRGQPFRLILSFYRDARLDQDGMNLVFETGNSPSIADSSKIVVNVSDQVNPNNQSNWSIKIDRIVGNELDLTIHPDSHTIVGHWNVKVVTSLKKHNSNSSSHNTITSQSLIRSIYMLFNPWNSDDQVFMQDENERNEYITSDIGRIWRGCYNDPRGYYWAFSQFEEDILDACLSILEKSRLPCSARSSPLHVARIVSQMINSVDDMGVLVGNWTQSFMGGTAPSDWTGSASILRRYTQSSQPVCFGQCWVFSGVITTILRALGIPSRVVTNYGSARDCSNISGGVNLFVKNSAKLDLDHTRDVIWNFHTWNEFWVKRTDVVMSSNLDGWQAIDATPQEKLEGYYYAGPAPVRAIKQGVLGYGQDSMLFHSEINGSQKIFISTDDNEQMIGECDEKIGRMIVTKEIDSYSYADITETYKDVTKKKLSNDNEISSVTINGQTRKPMCDIDFSITSEKPVEVGETMMIVINMENMSDTERTVKLWMRIEARMYHSNLPNKLKVVKSTQKLTAGQRQSVKIPVPAQDYLGRTFYQSIICANMFAEIEETKQVWFSTEDFCLRASKMDLTMQQPASNPGKPGHSKVLVQFSNPLLLTLTKCKLMIDGPGLIEPTEVFCQDVPPKGKFQAEFLIHARKCGSKKMIICNFVCDQLTDVQGVLEL